ncbi:unnamed protein product [Strongylus vulgaris]|uniref:Uncharacterized protein n=1 Tax=Strongylus vulgaris TaxID=40348 RepID=A0A3P7J7S7_STRVU|nr:unnamed protein product [Strongylus vulgaris]
MCELKISIPSLNSRFVRLNQYESICKLTDPLNQAFLGNVSNISDERVAGQDQRLPNGNRTYSSQFNQLGSNTPREQVHATPAYSNHTDSIGDVRGCANPRINIQVLSFSSIG